MTPVDSEELSRAIVVWSGWADATVPIRDDARLAETFGDKADRLSEQIREAENQFYASDARDRTPDLDEMGRRAVADFRRKRTDLSDDAVDALAWCYTYDYK
jgi:hypothetical protein